uniref:Uncharacterized protein n=1 Tax=Candidatus Kentrum sp. DK TaxID=2126562 RepID=A0A450S8E5_9GAMM|nr:MAG: hypothetical protein BECKDK2373C_GA0170839_102030 [Candidatus Kentron sp. DK]VFJ53116.1 MAG: hypothetical protein BECKDK2373B_GA0170837_10414 [Candidatus Kentron sp. DK]
MEKERIDVGEYSSWSKVGISILISTLASAVGFISAFVFTETAIFSGVEFSHPPVTAIVIMGGAVLLTVIFTFLLSRHERGSFSLTELKDELTVAYLSALEESTLNPSKGYNDE